MRWQSIFVSLNLFYGTLEHICIFVTLRWHWLLKYLPWKTRYVYALWRQQMETFPRYLPFVWGIHRSTVNSPHKGQRSFDAFFDPHLNKRLSKQTRRRWFETPSCSLWRHCNGLEQCCGVTFITPPICYLINDAGFCMDWNMSIATLRMNNVNIATLNKPWQCPSSLLNLWMNCMPPKYILFKIHCLMQKRRNTFSNALGLRIFCIKQSICRQGWLILCIACYCDLFGNKDWLV